MKTLSATGMGIYLPKVMHTNATLPKLDKPITEQQLERIGVTCRGWAGEGEGIAEMGAAAARNALKAAGLQGRDIDLIVLANWTQRRYIPEFAPKLQKLIGAPSAFAFDISGACTGFANGVGIAHHMLSGNRYKRALVVASETTSQRGRPNSKASLVFGDAAAAWVLELDAGKGTEILDYEMISDGEHHDVMSINEAGHVVTHIDQRELNALAAQSFTTACQNVLERNRLTIADVDWIVPHSGTAGIQALLVKTLNVPAEKVLSNFSVVGNVSSAAIPVSLDHFVAAGKIKKGDLILSPTTGTGWYYASLLYRL